MWGGVRIDSVPWTGASGYGTEVIYSTWGFPGQTVYYHPSGDLGWDVGKG